MPISRTEVAARMREIEEAKLKVLGMLESGEIRLNGAWGRPTSEAAIEALMKVTDSVRTGNAGGEMKIPAAVLKKYRSKL